MRTVRLNGELGKRFGRLHRLDVATPAEAIRALLANFPAIRDFLVKSGERGVAYRCLVDRDVADEERLTLPMSRTFSITPVVHGAGKVGSIILGAALVATAIFAPALIPTLAIHGATVFGVGTVATIGAALMLGGISQLLTPTPKAGDTAKQEANPYFDGPVNVSAQGAAVPIGYGRAVVGSVVISAAMTVDQQISATTFTAVGGFHGGALA